jgi:phenylalanyl-tRNA synthetase beta chain
VKFSYNWMHELVDGLKTEPHELMRLITLKTAECEGVEEFAPWLDRVVAAKVLSVEPIEGSHNVKAIVDAGPAYGSKTVVCGAPNCKPGMITAYVPPGTRLGDKEIGKAKINGVESEGMLASAAELGLNRDHSGIVVLDAEPGAPVPGCRPDWVIEVDNKSLTHRPDLWGHHGMAREVAAIAGGKLREPADASLIPAGPNAWKAEILEYDLCPRYSALVFVNVTVGPSPLWLQARLNSVGLNSISNIVDVTNLIMAEMGQPMHAFDAAKLCGKTIFVRRAKDGETFVALNGESYVLSPAHLAIADESGAVALAGVIGGADTAIGDTTKSIVLESANFQAANIRKTSSALRLRTDASMRFEKAQDPVNTVRALARAVELLQLVSPGIRVTGGLVDNWKQAPAPPPIELPMDWLERKLGRTIESAEVRRILESLEFTVAAPEPRVFSVSVPSWRATRDVTIKDDLLEEIGRMIGYDQIPPLAPLQPVKQPWVNEERLFHHRARALVAAQGFTETYNYSFVSEEMARLFHMDPDAHLRVANPISSEQSLLRISLLPGLHKNILENAKRYESFRLFEIGYEIHKRGAELPDEVPHLMAALYAKGDGQSGLFELKRLAECLLPGGEARPAEAKPFEHPARAAAITWRGETMGRLFELHPSLVENGRAAILDIDLGAMFRLGPVSVKYTPLRRFPSSAFDLSVVTGLRELAGDVKSRISAAAGPGCDSVEYRYSYTGAPLPEDRQSMTFRLSVSADDHTLTAEEVTAIRTRIIEALRSQGYDLRI